MTGDMENEAYEKLKERFEELKHIRNAMSILHKDSETNMAPGSELDRVRQLTVLSAMEHRMLNDPAMTQLLAQAEQDAGQLCKEDQRNLKLMRAEIENAAMPENLATEIARLESEGRGLHTRLKPTGDWKQIKDWYRYAFDTMRAIGQDKAQRRGFSSPYEALLDTFSPGISAEEVDRELGRMEKALPALIREAADRQKHQDRPVPLTGPFPKEQQQELCRRIVEKMGFDFNRGRFDMIDGHPSSGGTSDDTRFTTDCDEDNFLEAVYSTMHETGHAMYDQNQPKSWRYQPAGGHLGMAIHESMSRIMEIQAGQTPEFFEFLSREAQDVFNRPNDPSLSAENLRKLKQTVNPSYIRIYADELTYPAHIILRHKLEKALVDGTLDIEDLPQAWNDEIKVLLGITPPDASKGCMQDVHWPTGAIGYFPAYTLGDMGAAQLFAAACRDKPEIRDELRHGNFKPLREWLVDNVYSKGALMTPDELLTAATGEELNARYYLDHLSRRYLGRPYTPPGQSKAPEGPSNNMG